MRPHASMTMDHGISEAEWQARCDLAALYRLIAFHRWTDLIYTHISLRVPGPEHHFLINEYGVLFHEMRASDLVKIDLDGNIVGPHAVPRPVNSAGFIIHSAIHAAREDLTCVIHTHTSAGIAVSAQEDGLLPISQHALRFYGRLSYHGYEGVALDLDERDRLVADLGQNRVMILRNHGLLAAGSSVAQAFLEIYYLERACAAQVDAQAGGGRLVLPPESVRQRTAAQSNRPGAEARDAFAWRSALRLLEGQPEWRC
ncbi:class II aldolase/adducin family protein [Roseomonas fluvialis]|nr:class II aldolase/adducin family protein [Roseomonas fluvialis]